MRPVSQLERLARVLSKRTAKLEGIARQIQGKHIQDCSTTLTFVVVEALMTWTNFCRSYYLSCAICNTQKISGAKITHNRPNVVDEYTALLEAITVVKPNIVCRVASGSRINSRDEPTWHDRTILVRLSGRMNFSNNATIIAAFSYPSTFANDLPVVRNFFAHRCHDTARKVEKLARDTYGIRQIAHPADLVNSVIVGRAETLLIEWLMDMRTIGCALCR